MAKTSLAKEMREQPSALDRKPTSIGPFVTISREYGCHGFSLGLLLWDLLNEHAAPKQSWQIYHKEILARLATETNMAQEMLEQEMSSRPNLIADFLKFFSKEHGPSGYEIIKRVTAIIRGLAIQGRAIIVGQGGAAATYDLPNGLSIRLEAPEDWRIKQVSFREGLSEEQAREKIKEIDQERKFLRGMYEIRFHHGPAFDITYDCSVFTLTQIAQHVIGMMQLRKMI